MFDSRIAITAAALAVALVVEGARAATELAHYSFDTDFTDSVAVNNLTASSGTPNITATAGQYVYGGGALNLDQSGTQEHLGYTTAFNFNGSTAFSVSWWGQRSASSLTGQGGVTGTIANSNNLIWTPNNPAVVQGLRLRNYSGGDTDYGGIPDDNAYHFWALSYNGAGQVTVWRDGVSLGAKAFTGVINLTHVGAVTTSINNSFYGQIDELRLMSGTLSTAEVNNLRHGNSLSTVSATTLSAAADTYITSASPNTAQGSATSMVTNNVSTNVRISFIRFDVSGLTGYDGARLELTHAIGADGTQDYEVFGLLDADDDWVESALTWNNSTNRSGTSIDLADVYGGAALASFIDRSGTNTAGDLVVGFDALGGNIVNFLNADVDGLVTFVIVEPGASDGQGDGWTTREGFAANSALAPPRLTLYHAQTVTASVPAPAARPAGLGLLTIAATRRRRRVG